MMFKYKCVIFDCDGVLVDSEAISNSVLVEMANENGAHIDINYALQNFKGNAFKACLKLIETLTNKPLPNNFEKDFRQRTYDKFKQSIKPIDGIENVLKALQYYSIPFAVASSGPEDKIMLNLELTGLLKYFDKTRIFSCFTLKKWKPEPDIFLFTARTLGFKPSECVIIEDSLLGIQAAKRGAFEVFAYAEQNAESSFKNEATLIFNDMNDLIELLRL